MFYAIFSINFLRPHSRQPLNDPDGIRDHKKAARAGGGVTTHCTALASLTPGGGGVGAEAGVEVAEGVRVRGEGDLECGLTCPAPCHWWHHCMQVECQDGGGIQKEEED